MLKKIRLAHQITKFYKICAEELDRVPTRTKIRDLKDHDFLNQVLFDINEVLEAGADAFCEEAYALDRWLNNLATQINDFRNKPQQNYAEAITILLAVTTLVVGCIVGVESHKKVDIEPEHTRYTAYGRYYVDGTVITEDGNKWLYATDIISDRTPTDAMPVWVGFDDNGTPQNITDDIILGLVYDRNTAIYDKLEEVLDDKFELARDGNNIRIQSIKEVR